MTVLEELKDGTRVRLTADGGQLRSEWSHAGMGGLGNYARTGAEGLIEGRPYPESAPRWVRVRFPDGRHADSNVTELEVIA